MDTNSQACGSELVVAITRCDLRHVPVTVSLDKTQWSEEVEPRPCLR